jgi:hypothetical protein
MPFVPIDRQPSGDRSSHGDFTDDGLGPLATG